MRKFTLFFMSLFLMLGTAMAQSYSLTETRLSSGELNAKTAPTLIAIKNLSRTNNYYFVGNTGAVPYSAADFSDAAVFVWQPVQEGVAGSYYLMKLDGTYMQATSPKDFGTVDGAAVFTTTNPTTTGTDSANFNGDGDSQDYIDDEALLVRFVNAAGTWINVQNGDAGTPLYNSGKGGWTIHHVYAVEEAAVEPEAPFEVVAVTPAEAVAELTTVTIEFSEEIEGTFDMMGMTQIYLGTKDRGCSFEVNGKVLTITPFNAINTPGEYKLVIPEGLITRKSNGEAVTMNGEYVFTVKEAEAPFEVVAVTPTEAVAELTIVTIEFSEEIEGTFDMMGMTQIYLGTKDRGCSFEVNGKVLTITPFNAINTPGEYKLVIPEGLITRASNGEAVTMNGEYVFTVKEATVEPEPEVIPAANKSYTVVAEGHTTVSRPQWAINDEGTAFVSTGNTTVSTDAQKQFAFVTYEEAIYIYSISAKKFVMKDASLSDKNPDAVQLTELDNGKFFFKFDADHNVNIGGSGQMTIDWWSAIDGGNQFTLTEAGDFDAAEALALLNTTPEPEAPFEVVAVTPTEAVAELTTVTVEFSEEIEGTFDMMGMTQIYLGTKDRGCSFEVNGKVLTITPFNAINTPGEYKLVIPEGLITRKSNGEAVTMNGEYVFTVKEAGSIKDDNTIALIESANEILAIEGVGYPATTPREALKAAIAAAEEKPDTEAGTALQAAIDAYYATTDVVLPEGGKVYSLTMVAKNGNKFYLNYTGSDIAMVARTTDEELPNSAKFAAEDNGDGTVSLKTIDGKYLVYHSKYAGLDWLQDRGDTDGLQETKDDMTNITFAKMVNGNKVEATDDEQIFGMLTWYGKRGYDTGKSEDCYGYMVLKTDGSDYDGASVPFWNDGFSSAFIVEETEYIAEPLNVVAVTPAEDEVVNSLREITIEFDAEIAVKELSGTERIYVDYMGWKVYIYANATANGNVLTLVTDSEIKDSGKHTLVIPAGVVTRVSDGVAYEGGTFTFTVEKAAVVVEPLTVVAVTPAEAVETLETITIEFSDNVDVPATASGKFTIADADGNTVATLYAWDAVVEGKIVTLTLAEAITTAGEYTFSFAEGLVARQGDQATCAYTCTITVTGGTGIDGINGEAGESVIYDITGRKIEKITEGGIYIVNGKKVLVK